jgi:di/tricarboxylate transporter
MIRVALDAIRLEPGDVILVLGSTSAMRRLRFNRDVLLVEWSQTELPNAEAAFRALAIVCLTVAAAATGVLPIAIAAISGAFAMLAAGCLNIRQASRAFDRRIYLLVGASFAMAAPLEATGAAGLVAEEVVGLMNGSSPAMLLSAFFLLVALFTNILSNNATAALFTPIALSIAHQLGLAPGPFVLTVLFAANCSFATPMAYQTNLLVMGPGRYRFSDYLKTGGPLVILLWVVYSFIGPWYFGF